MTTEIMERLNAMENITIETIGSWTWIGGDTKPYKEELKEMGAFFAPKKKMWYFKPENSRNFKGRSGMDMDAIRAKYGNTAN